MSVILCFLLGSRAILILANFQAADTSVSREVQGWTEVQCGDHVQSSVLTLASEKVGS